VLHINLLEADTQMPGAAIRRVAPIRVVDRAMNTAHVDQ
jgi:hypothetical protein